MGAKRRGTRRFDRELEAGTAAHYEDAAYYAKTYATRDFDVRYYERLARGLGLSGATDAQAARGARVLEYGCGNGRIALPLARAGVHVTGVDLSKAMLGDFRARLRREDLDVRARLELRRGDMRKLALGRRFALVTCPFNAFLHLYERADVEAFLARVREHLAPRGLFVFDVSMPEPEELARDPARLFRTPRFLYPGTGDGRDVLVRYGERFDYDKLRQVLFVSMEFEPTDGSGSFMTPLAHRQFYPRELEALLHYNGFTSEFFGDFGEAPATRETRTIVVKARARKGA